MDNLQEIIEEALQWNKSLGIKAMYSEGQIVQLIRDMQERIKELEAGFVQLHDEKTALIALSEAFSEAADERVAELEEENAKLRGNNER